MFAGVPMLPFLAVSGTFLLLLVWSVNLVSAYIAPFLIIVYLPVILAMREVTRKDDQRLRQLTLRLKMRYRQQVCRRLRGAVSFSPLRYKQRKPSHAS